ncbi:M28 family peptidase [Myxococcus llanfairpwllgwyngyllgogerychwyrndrobwllllantysiliogogogochensis]|uniref:M28 family peptidase n=1 Tax=Myxococcus llanfairpwllgwyngyllgogerychwyrndrobwllllantysiliogogogochensis TaxID=2590453 RepID=A0A540WN00_9BACT|nr:M28 family peptidase [Myxococcus llanfairpwllgwyngyllgogerychwyrndrobwllllantysiliogogogochensis]TQF10386.1 M28 family peptidase [Myxococcus llanfairpwllgwyngyllgogerychwyrndrobwllllantysiliogogogochensis]
MHTLPRPFAALVVLAALSAAAQAPLSPLGPVSPTTGLVLRDDVVRALIQESSGDRIHDGVQRLALLARDNQGGYTEAAEWTKAAAEAAGLKDVRLEPMKDAPQWRATRGELWVTGPHRYRVTSHADLPMSLALKSGSFEGTGLELVDVGTGARDEEYAGKDLKGKVALTRGHPSATLSTAVTKLGAVGVVSSYSTPPWNTPHRMDGDFPDQVGWAIVPPGLVPQGARNPFLFMVSDRQGRELRAQMRTGPVKVDVSVATEEYPGHYSIVSGVIPGTRAGEEVVLTAHLDHYKPGADDNASGSATLLELVRTYTTLIRRGVLPPPVRTVRVLWLPEFEGTREWFSHHGADPVRRVAHFNFDMLGASLSRVHSRFLVSYTPDWNGSFVNAVSESTVAFMNRFNGVTYPPRKDFRIGSVTGSQDPLDAHMDRYSRGSDHQLFNDHGIPGVAFSTWPDDGYHTSGDRPENVDPTQLHRAAFAGLASITVAAWAEGSGALDLARLVAVHGVRRVAEDEFRARRDLASAPVAQVAGTSRLARAVVRAGYQREREALRSCQLLGAPAAAVRALLRTLETSEAQALERVEADVKARGGASREPAPTEAERRARAFVPRRVKGQELAAFDDVVTKASPETKPRVAAVQAALNDATTALRERGEGELRFYQLPDAIASYADGRRSVADIRDAAYAEYGYVFPVEALLDLFGLLEQGGIMTSAR